MSLEVVIDTGKAVVSSGPQIEAAVAQLALTLACLGGGVPLHYL